jgi:hypothetical protein
VSSSGSFGKSGLAEDDMPAGFDDTIDTIVISYGNPGDPKKKKKKKQTKRLES